MSVRTSRPLQNMLQAAVQSVQWTYSLFWKICPQQGILVWGDGYYNGAIKTRKMVQPMEVSDEDASLQRSQQLRELYDSLLSAGETNQQPARRPCAALSPEDLTESEWFYLMCVSFSFPPGVGLPGKAYAEGHHVWLIGANEVDSKTFCRAILAKSAHIQTVVCIPLLDGVVEFGTTDKVQEDPGFVQRMKDFFVDHHRLPPAPPKPALSEHSTSNPATSSDHLLFHSSPILAEYGGKEHPPTNPNQEEEDEEDEDEEGSDSEAETDRNYNLFVRLSSDETQNIQAPVTETMAGATEPNELMQLGMSEDIRLGSPDDGSNNFDSDFHLIGSINPDYQTRAEYARGWNLSHGPLMSFQPPLPGPPPPLQDMMPPQEGTHYSQTVSTILQSQPIRWTESSSSTAAYSTQSTFTKWSDHVPHLPMEGTSQWFLKYVLFSVPYLHQRYSEENFPKSRDADIRSKGVAAQDELSANHVLAERRRREKLNERFIILRSLVPFVTKMDKASILGDTIEYVKQLRKKNQDLEARNRQMEIEKQRLRASSEPIDQRSGATSVTRSCSLVSEKKKLRIVEGSSGCANPKTVETSSSPVAEAEPVDVEISVEVSIIESDALLELQCRYREGLLFDIMQTLRDLRIETTTIQSSFIDDMFMAELRAKVKDNVTGRRVSIVEVKRAICLIIN
ncbi:transcription factor BHLH42 [Mercurialis annua]|uniref:transcription factor BHLH42 n=1 Tax=Mercurialis annua TaxID=3986 RepID=UPI00215FA5B3|nr:transcription factor BHLH42 [Mercurialis annua]